ncbi:MAG: ABC transporter permease [Armatimonas sp.]
MLASLLHQALRALARNKLRSTLSVLGVSIGAAAVICTIALGNGGAAALQKELAGLGDNLVWVEAGGRTRDGVRLGAHKTKTLLESDAVAIVEQLSLIEKVSPQADGKAQVIFGNTNWSTSIKGVSREYFEIRRWTLESGVAFNQVDVERAANVCVLGQTVLRILFPDEEPLGKYIRVNHLPCEVIGTLMAKGQSATGQDQDDQVFMPFTTVQRKVTGELAGRHSVLGDLCRAGAPGRRAGQRLVAPASSPPSPCAAPS